nr:hypothetical protein [Acidobacteriota bacterium]
LYTFGSGVPADTFLPSTSATLLQLVHPTNATFTLTGSSITVAYGHTGTSSLELASINGFTGTVAITCTPPFPTNFTCSTQFASIALTPGLTDAFSYTLRPILSASALPAPPFSRSHRDLLAAIFPLSLLSLLGLQRRRRSHLRALLTLALLAILASATTACGPNHFLPIADTGTYPLTFTATATPQGATAPITRTLTLNAIITP